MCNGSGSVVQTYLSRPPEITPCPVCNGFPIEEEADNNLAQAADRVVHCFERLTTTGDAHQRVALSDALFDSINALKTLREK
jgi:hypothetical protein